MDSFYSAVGSIFTALSNINIFGIPFIALIAVACVSLVIVKFLKGGKD